jgi:hypothetical protein
MKIVNILGGLGNQMFEYAMFLALKDAHPNEVIKVCTRSFGGYGLHNGLEINRIFGLDTPEASLGELIKVAYPFFNYRTWQFVHHCLPLRRSMTRSDFNIAFDDTQITRTDSVYYDGYWQNEKNFIAIRSAILDAYRFPDITDEKNLELANRLSSTNSVSCHVRHGDYLGSSVLSVCSEEYYRLAVQEIMRRTSPDLFCIFSDDIPWCRKNLSTMLNNVEVVFVDWNKGPNSYRDMQLMSLCRHNIIANSSFSWWGAWLNNHQEKLVCAPRLWYRIPVVNDPIPSSWIKI